MILVNTSVWIDHLRATDPDLQRLLEAEDILVHAFVIGELALGNLQDAAYTLNALDVLPQIPKASDDEVRHLIRINRFAGTGIGYVDAHLLASTLLLSGTILRSRDRKLHRLAESLGVAAPLHLH